MSTLPAVVPRVFAGLSLICEQSPGDRAEPHIGGRAPNRRPLIESDGRLSIECVTPEHIYEVAFIEF